MYILWCLYVYNVKISTLDLRVLICTFRGLQSNNKRAVFPVADFISIVVVFNVCIFSSDLRLRAYGELRYNYNSDKKNGKYTIFQID